MNQVAICVMITAMMGKVNNGVCVPECRYYTQIGRIEDMEVIENRNEYVERLRQKNAIVEPPSESSCKTPIWYCKYMT